MHRGGLDADQADAALGAGRVVGDEVVGRQPSSTSVVWCAVETMRLRISTGPIRSGLRSSG